MVTPARGRLGGADRDREHAGQAQGGTHGVAPQRPARQAGGDELRRPGQPGGGADAVRQGQRGVAGDVEPQRDEVEAQVRAAAPLAHVHRAERDGEHEDGGQRREQAQAVGRGDQAVTTDQAHERLGHDQRRDGDERARGGQGQQQLLDPAVLQQALAAAHRQQRQRRRRDDPAEHEQLLGELEREQVARRLALADGRVDEQDVDARVERRPRAARRRAAPPRAPASGRGRGRRPAAGSPRSASSAARAASAPSARGRGGDRRPCRAPRRGASRATAIPSPPSASTAHSASSTVWRCSRWSACR